MLSVVIIWIGSGYSRFFLRKLLSFADIQMDSLDLVLVLFSEVNRFVNVENYTETAFYTVRLFC